MTSRRHLQENSVVSLDNVVTIPAAALGRQVGYLFPEQKPALSTAIRNAFDLE